MLQSHMEGEANGIRKHEGACHMGSALHILTHSYCGWNRQVRAYSWHYVKENHHAAVQLCISDSQNYEKNGVS